MRTDLLRRRDFLRTSLILAAWPAAHGLSDVGISGIRLVNGARAAGLDFVLCNGAQGRKYQVETLPGGLGVIDFDGDGWPDLFCTNGACLPEMKKSGPEYSNRLYRNNRDGTFTDVTKRSGLAGEGYCMGVAVGDYDNDGFEDLFVAGVHGNHLYRNNGDGTFHDVTVKAGLAGNGSLGKPPWTVAACWIDYDNDGYLDLFLSNYCDWSPGSDPVCGGVEPQSRAYCHPDKYTAQAMQLYHNNGNGTFTEVTRKEGLPDLLGKGMGIAMGYIAGSEHAGLFIANDNARNLLVSFEGKNIAEIGLEAGVAYNGDGRNISGMGAAVGDIDGDDLPDIVMTGLKNETYEVFLNRGHGSFDDGSASTGLLNLSRPWSGWGCGLVDLDNDGWLDLFVAGGGLDVRDAQANRVFQNNAGHIKAGRFVDVSDDCGVGAATPALHRGAVFADFDRDGRIDVAVSAMNAPLELWWNRTPQSHDRHWLQLRLTGAASNRSAIGAQVVCLASGRKQIRTVTNSVGYASSSDLTLHFGLGSATSAAIEIRWPSGVVQKVTEVKADQRLSLTEPKSKA
ncbi:CRTAC1 family protein [Acidicapsa dinghuensis]|uniref:CRTAC1 family protein n=1 Tax=Acidicapsa dinghuensis TaxID=2218256 RepID=A0ABW1EI37_9BACT|nr:CRTAC1 family protein [Acidicapsa dinghuensis]